MICVLILEFRYVYAYFESLVAFFFVVLNDSDKNINGFISKYFVFKFLSDMYCKVS